MEHVNPDELMNEIMSAPRVSCQRHWSEAEVVRPGDKQGRQRGGQRNERNEAREVRESRGGERERGTGSKRDAEREKLRAS